jgi:hypothetical protein
MEGERGGAGREGVAFAAFERRYQWNFDSRSIESVVREAEPEVVGSIFKIMMIVICYLIRRRCGCTPAVWCPT